jgi:hypothetical protein
MSQLVEKIKIELKAFEQKKADLVEELRKEFPELLKSLFDTSDWIHSVGWTQYTPYFNDGDECTFQVNLDLDYGFIINGEEDFINNSTFCSYPVRKYADGVQVYEDWLKRYPEDKINPDTIQEDLEKLAEVRAFNEVLMSIPDDFYLDLFGNHVKVEIDRTGKISVESYDHD